MISLGSVLFLIIALEALHQASYIMEHYYLFENKKGATTWPYLAMTLWDLILFTIFVLEIGGS